VSKPRLGRGLDALLGITDSEPEMAGNPAEVAIERIQRNPFQPRKSFDEDELASLGASVRNHGILQPLVVRQVGDQFQLIAGERRLRAAQLVGLATVPVRIVDFNDQQVLEAALVENIQRADLNPIEKAVGFRDYLQRFEMSHEQLAERLGLSRTSISNLVNLLDLAAEVQEAIRVNQITEGHAKALKGLKGHEDQISMLRQIVAQGLSVKATEQLIRDQKTYRFDGAVEAKAEGQTAAEPKEPVEKTNHVRSLEDELRQRFAVPVEIRLKAKDKGQFIIHFETNDDFMRLMEYLRR